MKNRSQNLTLVIDPDLLLAARKAALDRRTSLNQLVRQYLASIADQPVRRRIARARLKAAFSGGIVELGPRTWTRDQLHERR